MKKCILVCLCLFLLSGCARTPFFGETVMNKVPVSLPKSVKAIWISQFDLTQICVKNGEQRPLEEYRSRVVLMIAKLRSMGINTVFLQVRPNADAFYPSALFPASAYAVGQASGTMKYDPLAVWTEECHRGQLSLHAWINPLRCMATNSPAATDTRFPVGKWIAEDAPYVQEVDGYYYLDPAYECVRTLITDGAEEILKNYDVDGIHIDDYFYPTTDEKFDREAYAAMGSTQAPADFRRDQINRLIQELYAVSHKHGRLFGVSPSGNTERNYHTLYADTETWCREGYVDYLCPQIYFGLEHQSHPFEAVCLEFSEMTAGTNTALIIGMTLEKAAKGTQQEQDVYAGRGAREWIERQDVLLRCLEITRSIPHCRGVAYFSYRLFFSPDNGTEYAPTAAERNAFLPLLQEITW